MAIKLAPSQTEIRLRIVEAFLPGLVWPAVKDSGAVIAALSDIETWVQRGDSGEPTVEAPAEYREARSFFEGLHWSDKPISEALASAVAADRGSSPPVAANAQADAGAPENTEVLTSEAVTPAPPHAGATDDSPDVSTPPADEARAEPSERVGADVQQGGDDAVDDTATGEAPPQLTREVPGAAAEAAPVRPVDYVPLPDRLLEIFTAIAASGEVVPNNLVLAERLGTTEGSIASTLWRLKADKVIGMEKRRFSKDTHRKITIVATGAETAWPPIPEGRSLPPDGFTSMMDVRRADLLAVFSRLVREQRPMPSNGDLARAIGLTFDEATLSLLGTLRRELESSGEIKIERIGNTKDMRRRVYVRSLDKWSPWPDEAPARREEALRSDPPKKRQPAPVRVAPPAPVKPNAPLRRSNWNSQGFANNDRHERARTIPPDMLAQIDRQVAAGKVTVAAPGAAANSVDVIASLERNMPVGDS